MKNIVGSFFMSFFFVLSLNAQVRSKLITDSIFLARQAEYKILYLPGNAQNKNESTAKPIAFPSIYRTLHIPTSFASTRNDTIFDLFEGGDIDYLFARTFAISLDKNFLLMEQSYPIPTKHDSIFFSEGYERIKLLYKIRGEIISEKIGPRNAIHINQIMPNLAQNLGKKTHEISQQDYKNQVHYFSQDFAKSKFNADSAAIYDYWPKRAKVLKVCLKPIQNVTQNYVGSRVYMIMKRDVAFALIYCFYTEEGKLRINQVMKEIEGIIRFKH